MASRIHRLLLLLRVFWSSAAWALEYPTHISLRAGVLHAPPFAYVETAGDGSISFSGFETDMLERLKTFAAQDNVTLEFDLSPSPPNYGDALDLVANDCPEGKNDNTIECNQFE